MDAFKEAAKKIAEAFLKVDKKATIKIVSHLDTDGICAASILVSALNALQRKYTITILPQLKEKDLEEFSKDGARVIVFTDLGSGQVTSIVKHLSQKEVFILDHHVPEASYEQIHHLNPCLYGIDGSRAISGAGVVYFFTKALTQSTAMAHIAIIGAIGDTQEQSGFLGPNKEILDDAIKSGSMSVTKGLKFFGLQTRPLYKLLQYSTDVIIPGITGDEEKSIAFLEQLGINPRIGKTWKKLPQLTPEEKKILIQGIIGKREGLDNPDDIFTNVYILNHEDTSSPLREAKEFSTLLNACGRLGKASLGIGACLNDEKIKQRAVDHLYEYKHAILDALNWYNKNKDNEKYVYKKEGYMIINAHNQIRSTIIGTLASIISKGNEFKKGMYIVSLAQNEDITTKISLRVSGNKQGENLQKLMKAILEKLDDGEGGGHMHAAGAIIPTEKESAFISITKSILDEITLEEDVE